MNRRTAIQAVTAVFTGYMGTTVFGQGKRKAIPTEWETPPVKEWSLTFGDEMESLIISQGKRKVVIKVSELMDALDPTPVLIGDAGADRVGFVTLAERTEDIGGHPTHISLDRIGREYYEVSDTGAWIVDRSTARARLLGWGFDLAKVVEMVP
jgi:hypothetical protein